MGRERDRNRKYIIVLPFLDGIMEVTKCYGKQTEIRNQFAQNMKEGRDKKQYGKALDVNFRNWQKFSN